MGDQPQTEVDLLSQLGMEYDAPLYEDGHCKIIHPKKGKRGKPQAIYVLRDGLVNVRMPPRAKKPRMVHMHNGHPLFQERYLIAHNADSQCSPIYRYDVHTGKQENAWISVDYDMMTELHAWCIDDSNKHLLVLYKFDDFYHVIYFGPEKTEPVRLNSIDWINRIVDKIEWENAPHSVKVHIQFDNTWISVPIDINDLEKVEEDD